MPQQTVKPCETVRSGGRDQMAGTARRTIREVLYRSFRQADIPAMRLALYEPDIPQNTGTILRLAACFGVAVDIIEPAGFSLSGRALRRAGLDYIDWASVTRHDSWSRFQAERAAAPENEAGRLVLLTTKADTPYTASTFRRNDTLLFGRESAGVPDDVHEAADARLVIPMRRGMRSLNVAVAVAMVLGEALRQTGGFPARAGERTGQMRTGGDE